MGLGVERDHLKVKDLAGELGTSPDGMIKAITRAVRKRTEGNEFRLSLNTLDRGLARLRNEDD